MGLFDRSTSAADLYIDLGTTNTLVADKSRGLVVNEPSLIAYNELSQGKRQIVAVGLAANESLLKTAGQLRALNPLLSGSISDVSTTEAMVRYFIERSGRKSWMFKPRVVASLPFGVTELEKETLRQADTAAVVRSLDFIEEPMTAAVGANLPVEEARGSMLVDIGGGTTGIALIALSEVVDSRVIRVGGHRIDLAIADYLKRERELLISETAAERVKIDIGTALPKSKDKSLVIVGRDPESGLQKKIQLHSHEIAGVINVQLKELIHSIQMVIENSPPELLTDVMNEGIFLCGGGALLHGMAQRIAKEVEIPVHLTKSPLTTIACGGEKVISNAALFEKIKLE